MCERIRSVQCKQSIRGVRSRFSQWVAMASDGDASSLDQEDVLLKEMEDSNEDSLKPQDAWMGKLNDSLGALASSMQSMQHSLSRLQPSAFAIEEDSSSFVVSEPAAKR